MNLPLAIRDYYYSHFSELPNDKQFHFASRLHSWNNDTKATEILEYLRSSFITDSIKADLIELTNNPPSAKINAAERRTPYFKKYPQLRGYMLALFRVRHLLYHYNTDVRKTLLRVIPIDALYALSDQLQNDKEAVKILSTYAVNYIYLVEVILFPRGAQTIESFLKTLIESTHEYTDTAEDSLLMIYLFTHCIIGASNFYQSRVTQPIYKRMILLLEERIKHHYQNINLDNKFEFIVCCTLVNHSTNLEAIIENEAQKSVSTEGTFLVDTINTAGQLNKTSFVDSEHRNVLYIMSRSAYTSS